MTPQQTAEGLSLDDLERLRSEMEAAQSAYEESGTGDAKLFHAANNSYAEYIRALRQQAPRLISELRAAREAQPDLSHVINWLAQGCSVEHAVTELRIYQARIEAARTASEASS